MLLNSTNAEQPRSDKYLTIPVELKWDLLGQDDAIDEYQKQMVKEIIGKPIDYESSRFSNNLYVNTIKSDINYEFYFFNGNPLNLSNSSNWVTSYAPQQFDNGEIYYNAKSFTKSFFKLDLYDTKESKTQINFSKINQINRNQYVITYHISHLNKNLKRFLSEIMLILIQIILI